MMNDKIVVFYNNITYEIITVLVPNDTDINIDEFIINRIKYDKKCSGLNKGDISYEFANLNEYNRAINDYENGGEVSVNKVTKKVVISGIGKDFIEFNNIKNSYEFHLEYNTKLLNNIFNLEYLSGEEIFVKQEEFEHVEDRLFNQYLEENTIEDLKKDILLNGMYFPFFGYYENEKFYVTEGCHRAMAVAGLKNKFLCISKNSGEKFNFDLSNSNNLLSIYFYEYLGNNKFIRREMKNLDKIFVLYVSNNIILSEEIFKDENRIDSCYFISNEINLERLPNEEIIKKSKIFYSMMKCDIEKMYQKFCENKKIFETKKININDIFIENIEQKNENSIKINDPFLYAMEEDELLKDILNNGMAFPFVVYLKDEKYYIAEGYHRYQVLKNNDINCDVECIVADFESIFNRYPKYSKDFEIEIYIPKNIFPYQEYPYVPTLDGFIIKEDSDLWRKIIVTNKFQLMQAYKLMPMVLKYMINYIYLIYGETIVYDNNLVILDE